jgi:hypothetical protein
MQPGLDRSRVNAKYCGGFCGAEFLDVTQFHNPSMLLGQPIDALADKGFRFTVGHALIPVLGHGATG